LYLIFQDEFIGAFLQSTLVPMELCGYVLSVDCGVPVDHRQMWNVTLPNTPKPPVIPPKSPVVCYLILFLITSLLSLFRLIIDTN